MELNWRFPQGSLILEQVLLSVVINFFDAVCSCSWQSIGWKLFLGLGRSTRLCEQLHSCAVGAWQTLERSWTSFRRTYWSEPILQLTEQEKLYKKLQLRYSAQQACAKAEIDVMLRRALLRKYVGRDEELSPGERCLNWRESPSRFQTLQWRGSAVVVAVQRDLETNAVDVYWLAHGTSLIPAGKQHVRQLPDQSGVLVQKWACSRGFAASSETCIDLNIGNRTNRHPWWAWSWDRWTRPGRDSWSILTMALRHAWRCWHAWWRRSRWSWVLTIYCARTTPKSGCSWSRSWSFGVRLSARDTLGFRGVSLRRMCHVRNNFPQFLKVTISMNLKNQWVLQR